MSWVADGQDGNGLHLEKTGLIFSFGAVLFGAVFTQNLKITMI